MRELKHDVINDAVRLVLISERNPFKIVKLVNGVAYIPSCEQRNYRENIHTIAGRADLFPSRHQKGQLQINSVRLKRKSVLTVRIAVISVASKK